MPDQDAINVVLEGTIDYLHPKYNCLLPFCARREFIKTRVQPNEFKRVQEAAKNPAIVHYVFANKPWFKGEYIPYREEWLRILTLTPWKDIPIHYRNGWKGFVQISAKRTIRFILGIIGIDYKPNIFYKKQYKHIQILFLVLYYGFAQWLPDSFIPVIGKYANLFRRWCVKHLFDFTGQKINIGLRAYFGKGENIWIGSRSNIGAHCHIPSNIVIGDNVMMGPYNYFFENVTHNFQNTSIPMIDQGIRAVDGRIEIGDDVWIGRECMIMPGKKISSHSIIGARSLVTKNVDEYAIVGGNPAKIIKMRK